MRRSWTPSAPRWTTARSIDRVYTVTLTDAQGVVYAEVEKVIYIRRDTPAATGAPDQDTSGAATATRS